MAAGLGRAVCIISLREARGDAAQRESGYGTLALRTCRQQCWEQVPRAQAAA